MPTTMAAEDRIPMQEDQLCCFEEADVQVLRLGEDQEPVVVVSNFLCADVLAELRATLAATSHFEEGIHWEDLGFAFPGPQFWMRRHFHLPDSWLRFLRQHPLSLAMAPILFDMSILDICFSRLASTEKPLWGSMTPLLNVSCGPRIFHPTCVDVNMICFSTYAREMENTIVHIDTFGGEGTWTNFVFNLRLACRMSASMPPTGTAFWKEVGARTSARPRSGEAKGKKAFRKQVQRMQDMLSYGRDHMMAWREHPESFGWQVPCVSAALWRCARPSAPAATHDSAAIRRHLGRSCRLSWQPSARDCAHFLCVLTDLDSRSCEGVGRPTVSHDGDL
mmetsp:Transcript_43008/g.89719  ORF Transcript_43008/g.89719 Transcript_43008/m.89719 type:complete len:335 (+) Transcript_43008:44-1048(+)